MEKGPVELSPGNQNIECAMKTRFKVLLPLLLLLALPAAVRAQFTFTTNNGAITITGYTGSGGAVNIPDAMNIGGLNLPVTSIGGNAFASCASLASISIPNSVTNIGYGAFYDCTNLTNVTIGNGVTSIADGVFYSCYRLTSVTIPNSVTSIGDNNGEGVFSYCSGLTSVTIGNGVTSIAQLAFRSCSSLTSVMLPTSVTSIGSLAFESCGSLTGVYFKGNAPSTGFSLFLGDNNATVYYLPGTTNWVSTFGGLPAVLWNPQVQTSGASFGVRTNRFGFTITGTSNLVIVVEACTNLAHPIWSPVATNTLTGGSSYFSDPHWMNYPAHLFRLRSP